MLPNLVGLELAEGTFVRAFLTSQLTGLSLCQAKVHIEADGKEGCGLQHLSMASSQVFGLRDGACACTSLKEAVM